MVRLGKTYNAGRSPIPPTWMQGIYTSEGEKPKLKKRERWERKGGGNDKGKERELGRACCGVKKILKIDPDERLYLFRH